MAGFRSTGGALSLAVQTALLPKQTFFGCHTCCAAACLPAHPSAQSSGTGVCRLCLRAQRHGPASSRGRASFLAVCAAGGTLRIACIVAAGLTAAGGVAAILAWQLAQSFQGIMIANGIVLLMALAAPVSAPRRSLCAGGLADALWEDVLPACFASISPWRCPSQRLHSQAAVVSGSMWALPSRLHAMGMAWQNVLMFGVGDIPPPLLIGLLQTYLSSGVVEGASAQPGTAGD